MRRTATKGTRVLTVDRIFESSRMGKQAMATSYTAVVPIKICRLPRKEPGRTDGEQVVGTGPEVSVRAGRQRG